MKRTKMKRFLQNKWMVPVSALVLTLCIGSFALASTNPADPYSFVPTSSSSTTAVTRAVAPSSSSTTSLPNLQYQTVSTTPTTPTALAAPAASPADAAAAAAAAAELQLQQAKENAILDLIGEKMSADDKTIFDQLRATATDQQLALSRAQADLQATKDQITALIDKYLGMSDGLNLGLAGPTTSSTARVNSIPEQ